MQVDLSWDDETSATPTVTARCERTADFAEDPAIAARVANKVGKGGFNVTSTCEFSDGMCQGKGPLFENSTRDVLSSKNESNE